MQPGTAMSFLNFYTLVFWTPLCALVSNDDDDDDKDNDDEELCVKANR